MSGVVITPSNIHLLPMAEHVKLKEEALSFGLSWYDIRRIERSRKRVVYDIYLYDETGSRYVDEDGNLAIEVKGFDR